MAFVCYIFDIVKTQKMKTKLLEEVRQAIIDRNICCKSCDCSEIGSAAAYVEEQTEEDYDYIMEVIKDEVGVCDWCGSTQANIERGEERYEEDW